MEINKMTGQDDSARVGVSSKRCETIENDLTTIDECSNKWSLTGE
jgi:hypothetical protein